MPDNAQNTDPNTNPDGAGDQPQGEAITYESWIETLEEPQQNLVNDHIAGLKSALESERTQRKDLSKQLRDVAAKAEKGSELEQQLSELSGQLEAAENRAAFYEDAARAEVGCTNAKLAWIAANEIDAIDRRGRVNWEAVKGQFPELFQSTTPRGNAGAGTASQQPTSKDMNKFIRAAAGRPIS